MSVTFDAEGTITIAGTHVLGRPTLRQYRQLRDSYRQAVKRMQEAGERANQLAAHEDDHTDAEAEQILDELNDFLESWHHDWIKLVASTLGAVTLPADPEDWPADLALDPVIPGRMLDHWRRVPLVHGSNRTS